MPKAFMNLFKLVIGQVASKGIHFYLKDFLSNQICNTKTLNMHTGASARLSNYNYIFTN